MYRLLIADDEQIERMVLHKTLAKHMADICEIYQAENGREALAIYEEKDIQIAILDIEMPGINGIQAAEKIRQTDKDCGIIFLTAYDEFSYAKKAITIRAIDYLLKPYQEEELLAVLDEAILQIKKREQQKINEQLLNRELDYRANNQLGGSAVDEMVTNEELVATGQIRITKVAEMIEQFIQEHYMEDISMHQVAEVMNYSEAYFCKLFKQCFSRNFTVYLTEFRLAEAKKLLEKPMVNVKDIGKAVGYSDSNYFAKVFRRHTGSSPTEYRMKLFSR